MVVAARAPVVLRAASCSAGNPRPRAADRRRRRSTNRPDDGALAAPESDRSRTTGNARGATLSAPPLLEPGREEWPAWREAAAGGFSRRAEGIAQALMHRQ